MTDYEQKMYDAAKLWLELVEREDRAKEAHKKAHAEYDDAVNKRCKSLDALRKFADDNTPQRAIVVGQTAVAVNANGYVDAMPVCGMEAD